MARFLAGNGLEFQREVKIGYWVVDFLVGRVVIEADGTYWHSKTETKVRDARKTRRLRAWGYEVVRLPETEVEKGDDRIFELLSGPLELPR